MKRWNLHVLGLAAAAAMLTASAQAAPLSPQPIDPSLRASTAAHPALTTSEEAAQLKPEQVRWHGHWHHGGWGHRHWGWHHRRWGWHHRGYGWHRGWHHRHWRHW